MLIEFRVENFRSFKESQTLSMVASSDNSLKRNCIEYNKNLKILNSAAIYGPNASGKSNLIQALYNMQTIVVYSARFEKELEIPIQPFKFDEKSKLKPTVFELVFIFEGIRHQYGFSILNGRIEEEWLYSFPKGQAVKSFERTYDRELGKIEIEFGNSFRGERKLLSTQVRKNQLILSVGENLKNEQLGQIYNWLGYYLRVIPSGAVNINQVTARKIFRELGDKKSQKEYYSEILSLLRKADFGINKIEVEEEEVDESADSAINYRSQEDLEKNFDILSMLKVRMFHKNPRTNSEYSLEEFEESEGTQRYFELIGPLLDTIKNGYTVFIDEIERSLHPLLVRHIIEFIQNPESNKNGAQLVFTTHNPVFLDQELFRRDQIWFTDKDEIGATKLYSLWDYKQPKARKSESWHSRYLSGRYGAIPIIDEFELND